MMDALDNDRAHVVPNQGGRLQLEVPTINAGSEEDFNLRCTFSLRNIILPDGHSGLTNAKMLYVIEESESSRTAELSRDLHFNFSVPK